MVITYAQCALYAQNFAKAIAPISLNFYTVNFGLNLSFSYLGIMLYLVVYPFCGHGVDA